VVPKLLSFSDKLGHIFGLVKRILGRLCSERILLLDTNFDEIFQHALLHVDLIHMQLLIQSMPLLLIVYPFEGLPILK
jgi:hypothetical protein